MFPFDSAKIAGYRATVASRLGLASIAMEAFSSADTARSPKQAALVAVEHARVLATAGHLDQAYKLAVAAYDISQQYEFERVQQAVRHFRTSLSPRPGPVTAELDERPGTAYGRPAHRPRASLAARDHPPMAQPATPAGTDHAVIEPPKISDWG